MRNYKNSIILFFILLSFSCVQELIPPLEVKDCIFENDEIIFNFSDIPKETSFRNNVTVFEDETIVSGKIIFEKTNVKITLKNGFQKNKNYTVNISSALEDKKGRSLLQDYVFEFTTRKENLPPVVEKIIPNYSLQDNQEELKEIEIYFSEAIDIASFNKSFSVTPSFDYLCKYNLEKTCIRIIPVSPINQNERYVIKISSELMDVNSNSLKDEYSYFFDFNINSEIPIHRVNVIQNDLITEVTTDTEIELNREKILQFEWNKKIFLDGVDDLFFIEPDIPFEIQHDEITKKSLTIDFDFSGMWGRTFELKLVKGVKDTLGNITKQDYTYKLKYCDENDRPILFNCALLKNGTTFKIIKSEEQYDSLIFDLITFPATSGNNCVQTELFFIFTVSNNSSGIDRFSAMENISLTASNCCCDILIKKLSVLSVEDELVSSIKNEFPSIFTLSDNQGKFSIVHCLVDIENTDKKGLITLDIKQEIADDLKNTMEKEIICKVNKL